MSGLRQSGMLRLVALVAVLVVALVAGTAPRAEAWECGCTYGPWVEIYYYNNGAHTTLVGYETCNYCWGVQTQYYVWVNGCPEC